MRSFEPLSQRFRSQWQSQGFDLPPERFETLNLEAYSCPLCTVSDRERLYALYLEGITSELSWQGERRFIEFAPIGALTWRIRHLFGSKVEVRTADFFMDGVDDRVDLCDMKTVYADASADMFLCSHVLEHVPDDRQALRELYRILKPGGRGIVMAPVHLDLQHTREGEAAESPEMRWKLYGQDDHVRLYSKPSLAERIQSAGFKLQALGMDHFGPEVFRRHGVHERSVLYVAHKPL